MIKKIERWFKVSGGGGLMLPDGWFGRPHDNQHQLTYITARPHMLLLEADSQLLLVFTELKRVAVENNQLLLGDFAQLVFDWQEFGSMRTHATIYDTGQVVFVPPIGTIVT